MELSPELIISSMLVPLIGGIDVYLVTQINRSGERMAEFSNKVSDAMSVIAQRVVSSRSRTAPTRTTSPPCAVTFACTTGRSSGGRRRRRAPSTSCGWLERLARAVESVCVYFTKG